MKQRSWPSCDWSTNPRFNVYTKSDSGIVMNSAKRSNGPRTSLTSEAQKAPLQ